MAKFASKNKCCAGNKTIRDIVLFPPSDPTPPEDNSFLLKEFNGLDPFASVGDKILLETGDRIILET